MEMQEVKTALDEAGRLYKGQFEDINSKIKALEAKGAAVDPLLKEQRDKLNEAIEKASALNEQFIAQQATIQRLEKFGCPPGPRGSRQDRSRDQGVQRTRPQHRRGTVEAGAAPHHDRRLPGVQEGVRPLPPGRRKGPDPDEFRAMSVGSDLNGGYLVDPDETGQMVKKIFETSDVRRYASVQSISTDALEGSADLDEASGGWVSELGTRSDSTTPTVPQPWRIPVHELYSQPKASQKLINDASIDVASWLNGKVSDKLSRCRTPRSSPGSGVGQPRGFASYTTSTTYAWGTPEHVATGTLGLVRHRPQRDHEAQLADGAPEGIVRAWVGVLHDAADQVRDPQPDGCVQRRQVRVHPLVPRRGARHDPRGADLRAAGHGELHDRERPRRSPTATWRGTTRSSIDRASASWLTPSPRSRTSSSTRPRGSVAMSWTSRR
jgi:HK97 family phage major capsid protein